MDLKVHAGRCVFDGDVSVVIGFGFEDIECGVLQTNWIEEDAVAREKEAVVGRWNHGTLKHLSIEKRRGLGCFGEFDGIGSPEKLAMAQGKIFDRGAVIEMQIFKQLLVLLIKGKLDHRHFRGQANTVADGGVVEGKRFGAGFDAEWSVAIDKMPVFVARDWACDEQIATVADIREQSLPGGFAEGLGGRKDDEFGRAEFVDLIFGDDIARLAQVITERADGLLLGDDLEIGLDGILRGL